MALLVTPGGVSSFPHTSMSGETELELQRAFGRLEGKVDALLYEVRSRDKAQEKVVAEHGRRIASLETWRTRIIAIGSVIAFGFGVVLKFIH